MSQLQNFLISDINNAAKMLDRALNRLHPSLDIYKELKKVDDDLDSILMALEDGDYDIKTPESSK